MTLTHSIRVPRSHFFIQILLSLGLLFLSIGHAATAKAQVYGQSHVIEQLVEKDARISHLYWSDADSGKINNVRFRISNADAAETGRIGLRGGAKCYEETIIGRHAKDVARGLKRRDFKVTDFKGFDRSGRALIDLSYKGQDYVCLLYTSPSPRDKRQSRMPSSA